jgi:hypothetical protein
VSEKSSETKAVEAAIAKSPFRPMTDEERAELEAVYQDRGCGVDCDPDSPTCGPLAPRAETAPTDRKDIE